MRTPYLVTGAMGFLGAWVLKALMRRGHHPVAFDLPKEPTRLLALMGEEELHRVEFHQGDVREMSDLRRVLQGKEGWRIIHLAGLQVPTCQADPPLGASVNVVGTVNVFQAAVETRAHRVVYASSAAVFGSHQGPDPLPDETPPEPLTHYGVYKLANEHSAAIFFRTAGLSSVGLRPLTVYGVGRDQGLTSDPTLAMRAAVLSQPFRIRFTGSTDFQYAADVAEAFCLAAEHEGLGACVWNLHGETADVSDVIAHIAAALPKSQGLITFEGPSLPIPPALQDNGFRRVFPKAPKTSLAEGVRATLLHFETLRNTLGLEGEAWPP